MPCLRRTQWCRSKALHHSEGSHCVCAELNNQQRRSKSPPLSEGSCCAYAGLQNAEARPCITARARGMFALDPGAPRQGPASQQGLMPCLRRIRKRRGQTLHHSEGSCCGCACVPLIGGRHDWRWSCIDVRDKALHHSEGSCCVDVIQCAHMS